MAKLKVDLRLLDARAELPALRDSVRMLEKQLEFLAAQRRKQILADLPSDAGEADVQLAFQELHYEVEYTYPRVYRGALLVVIWAAYESAVGQVADFLQRKKRIALALSSIRGRGVFEQAKIYYPQVLAFELFATKDSASRVGQAVVLRNAFSHAAGRLAGLRPRARNAVAALERSGWVKEEFGYLVPTKKGLDATLEVIAGEVSSLIGRALAWDDEHPRSATDAH